jgi:taurine dioxygenase
MSLTITPFSPALGPDRSVDISRDDQRKRAMPSSRRCCSIRCCSSATSRSAAQQARFAARFGDLHIHPIYPNVPDAPQVMILDTAVTDVRDNAVWHTDVTFLPTPALGAVLSAGNCRSSAATPCGPAALRPGKRCPPAEIAGRADRHPRLHQDVPAERFGTTPKTWRAGRPPGATTRRCRTRWCARIR